MPDTTIIIVLGHKLKTNFIHPELKGRMDKAIKIYQNILNPETKKNTVFILSGGKTQKKIQFSEAEVMMEYCKNNKIHINEIIKESKSLDTIGNAVFTRKIVDDLKGTSKIFVVSSCYHMNRVRFIFDMVFGSNYQINYDHCHPFNEKGIEDKEYTSLESAQKFFKNIVPGDIKFIERHLFAIHECYKSNI